MKRALLVKGLPLVAGLVSLASLVSLPRTASADDPYNPGDPWGAASGASRGTTFSTWGVGHAPAADATSLSRDAPVTRAREMLMRARFLDEAAAIDEAAAAVLVVRLASMRTSAKIAREKAEKATPEEREALGARADDLETDVVVSEAEVGFKRRTAAENRRVARDLRLRAVKLVREAPALDKATADKATAEEAAAQSCDPPFRYAADGRKLYRVECLK
jgi:hypothetical protein